MGLPTPGWQARSEEPLVKFRSGEGHGGLSDQILSDKAFVLHLVKHKRAQGSLPVIDVQTVSVGRTLVKRNDTIPVRTVGRSQCLFCFLAGSTVNGAQLDVPARFPQVKGIPGIDLEGIGIIPKIVVCLAHGFSGYKWMHGSSRGRQYLFHKSRV